MLKSTGGLVLDLFGLGKTMQFAALIAATAAAAAANCSRGAPYMTPAAAGAAAGAAAAATAAAAAAARAELSLIVCPAAVLLQWQKQFVQLGRLKIKTFDCSKYLRDNGILMHA